MSKIIKIIFVIVIMAGIFGTNYALAAGIVPCGQSEDDPNTTIDERGTLINGQYRCTLCHFFILITMIVNFVLFKLTAPLALLMLIIGGAMFMLAAGNPSTITQARKLIASVLIGIVIIYGAYFLVGVFLQSVGLATWTKTIYEKWWDASSGPFTIDCEVDETTMAPLSLAPAPAPPIAPVAPFVPPIAPAAAPIIIPIARNFSSNATVITFP